MRRIYKLENNQCLHCKYRLSHPALVEMSIFKDLSLFFVECFYGISHDVMQQVTYIIIILSYTFFLREISLLDFSRIF